jgi:peptidoglycan hydrolase CwlO-like protein
LTNVRDNLVGKRNEIENIRSPNSAKLNELQNQLDDCGKGQGNIQRQIDDLNGQINGINNDIKKTQDDAASAPGAIDLINQQIPIVDAKIDDLQKQLIDAKNQKDKLIQDKSKYQKVI